MENKIYTSSALKNDNNENFENIIENSKEFSEGSFSQDSESVDLELEIEDIKNRTYFVVPK